MALHELPARLVARRGRDMVLRRVAPGDYGPGGSATGGAEEETAVRALIVGAKALEDAGLAVQTQSGALIAPADDYSVPPDTNDQLVDPSGRVHEIAEVQMLDFGEGRPAYLCALRGA